MQVHLHQYSFINTIVYTMEEIYRLFQQCLDAIPDDQKAAFELNYGVAARLDALLKEIGMTSHELAQILEKDDEADGRVSRNACGTGQRLPQLVVATGEHPLVHSFLRI
jgi:hypothetical protein